MLTLQDLKKIKKITQCRSCSLPSDTCFILLKCHHTVTSEYTAFMNQYIFKLLTLTEFIKYRYPQNHGQHRANKISAKRS